MLGKGFQHSVQIGRGVDSLTAAVTIHFSRCLFATICASSVLGGDS